MLCKLSPSGRAARPKVSVTCQPKVVLSQHLPGHQDVTARSQAFRRVRHQWHRYGAADRRVFEKTPSVESCGPRFQRAPVRPRLVSNEASEVRPMSG